MSAREGEGEGEIHHDRATLVVEVLLFLVDISLLVVDILLFVVEALLSAVDALLQRSLKQMLDHMEIRGLSVQT